MAKPNYAFQKRQKELAKKKKKEEKQKLKAELRLQKKLENASPDRPEEESTEVADESDSEPKKLI